MADTKNLKNPFRNNSTSQRTGSNTTLNTTLNTTTKLVTISTRISINTDYPDCCGIGCPHYTKNAPGYDYDCSLFKIIRLLEETRPLINATPEIIAMYGKLAPFTIRCDECRKADIEIVEI